MENPLNGDLLGKCSNPDCLKEAKLCEFRENYVNREAFNVHEHFENQPSPKKAKIKEELLEENEAKDFKIAHLESKIVELEKNLEESKLVVDPQIKTQIVNTIRTEERKKLEEQRAKFEEKEAFIINLESKIEEFKKKLEESELEVDPQIKTQIINSIRIEERNKFEEQRAKFEEKEAHLINQIALIQKLYEQKTDENTRLSKNDYEKMILADLLPQSEIGR